MTNGDSRLEDRVQALEELARITSEWAELMERDQERLDHWARDAEQRPQELERSRTASNELVSRMLTITANMQADINEHIETPH